MGGILVDCKNYTNTVSACSGVKTVHDSTISLYRSQGRPWQYNQLVQESRPSMTVQSACSGVKTVHAVQSACSGVKAVHDSTISLFRSQGRPWQYNQLVQESRPSMTVQSACSGVKAVHDVWQYNQFVQESRPSMTVQSVCSGVKAVHDSTISLFRSQGRPWQYNQFVQESRPSMTVQSASF